MPTKTTSDYSLEESDIGYYFDLDNLEIPKINGLSLGRKLNQLPVSKKTYSEAVDKAFYCEYWNDLNEEGYMVGIELSLTEDKFLPLVANQAFMIYDTRWRNRDFRVVTLDAHLEVIKKSNVIYPLTAEKDAFVVLAIDPNSKVATVKALISSRDDLYPLDYLRNPLFMLFNSQRYLEQQL
ncbi:MAG TPA: hypothetical protein VM640_07485 [Desulfitobacterium sp.]|nr:hypothetical protein [Desulfitobacterium sp.]